MNNLYQQLIYNWERGFYSVVKNREGYKIVSHRAPLDRLWVTATCDTLDLAKEQLGMSYTIGDNGHIDDFWQIVDAIHPSELMGKGFQVGDKVEVAGGIYTLKAIDGPRVVITNNTSVRDINTDYNHLKPVLPIEEQVDMNGKKEKEQVSVEDKLVTSTLNVEFDSGAPQVTLGYEISQRSHICNCGFWNSEKVWGETLYTQQFGDRCVSMSVTNNYVICSKCGQKLRRVAISYLDD